MANKNKSYSELELRFLSEKEEITKRKAFWKFEGHVETSLKEDTQQSTEVWTTCKSMIRQWCVGAPSVICESCNNQTSKDYRPINCDR